MYFLNKFSTFFCVRTFLMIKPWLPRDPELPPKSSKKKFMTCSGFLSSCLQMASKFVMAVFLVPCFETLGGMMVILVLSDAKSGLFLFRVSTMRLRSSLYRLSFFFLISWSFSSYYFAFPELRWRYLCRPFSFWFFWGPFRRNPKTLLFPSWSTKLKIISTNDRWL